MLGVQDLKTSGKTLRERDLLQDICCAIDEVKVETKEMQSNKTDVASNVDLLKHKSKRIKTC